MNYMQIQHYVISALVFAACTASVTLADTLEVPDEYPTIQLAIDAAVDGETGPHANPVFARNVTGSFEAPTAAAETAGDPRTHAGTGGGQRGRGRQSAASEAEHGHVPTGKISDGDHGLPQLQS